MQIRSVHAIKYVLYVSTYFMYEKMSYVGQSLFSDLVLILIGVVIDSFFLVPITDGPIVGFLSPIIDSQ